MCRVQKSEPAPHQRHLLIVRAITLLLCTSVVALHSHAAWAQLFDHAPGEQAQSAEQRGNASGGAHKTFEFDFARANAPEVLNEFSTQTGLQVLYAFEELDGITTNRVHGRFTPREALQRLTRGTRISYQFINERTVTLNASRQEMMPVALADVATSTDRRSLISPVEQVTIKADRERDSIAQLGSQLIALRRVDIDALGAPTVQEVLRTIPQVFGGGPNEDTFIGREAETNTTFGSGINLRGLGAGSTLVLINGHRVAGSGGHAIFADISNLPSAFVESIEILPDSSSVRFGADAVGGVINFVLRDSGEYSRTDALLGAATRSSLHELQFSHATGWETARANGAFAFDYYWRDNLSVADRKLARSNLESLGGSNFDALESNPGTIIIGSSTWKIPSGQDGTALSPDLLIPGENRSDWRGSNADLLPTQERISFYSTGRLDLSGRVQLFGDVLFTERQVQNTGGGVRALLTVPSSNPFYTNPTGGHAPIRVAYDFEDDLGPTRSIARTKTLSIVGTAAFQVGNWDVSAAVDFAADRTRSRLDNLIEPNVLPELLADTNPETALNVFGDGSHTNPASLARLRTSGLFRSNSHTWSGSVTGSRLVSIAGEDLRLMFGGDFRRQDFSSISKYASGTISASDRGHRHIRSGFVSASYPIGPRIEVSAAGRYDHYSDFGGRVSPRFGATWLPFNNLLLHASWSRSFRPPTLIDLDEGPNVVYTTYVPDITSTTGESLVLVQLGRNATLKSERAISRTFGWELTPKSLPGFSLATTYFRTRFTDRITSPIAGLDILGEPGIADLITREFTQEQLEAVCGSARFVGSADSCADSSPVAIADLRLRNSAYVYTHGIDMRIEQVWHPKGHRLSAGLTGTYLLSFKVSDSTALPAQERVSTQNNPIDLHIVGALDWTAGRFSSSARFHYFDNYRDISDQTIRPVDAWRTLDLRIAYHLGKSWPNPLSESVIALSVKNVFDQDPPFLNNSLAKLGYDQENGDLIGRTLSLGFQKMW
jgi:iron complex outermembrane receptor protein